MNFLKAQKNLYKCASGLFDEGIKFRICIYLKGEKTLLYCFEKDNHDSDFVYFVDRCTDKRLKLVNKCDSDYIDNEKIFIDYIPDYNILHGFIQDKDSIKSLSWKEGGLIHTVVAEDYESSVKFAAKIMDKSEREENIDLFNYLWYIPKKNDGWHLETLLMGYNLIEDDGIKHRIKILQGNYKNEICEKEKFINLEMRFGCQCDCEKIDENTKKLPTNREESILDIDGRKVSKIFLPVFKTEKNVDALSWYDDDNRIMYICHNNRTTNDWREYREDIMNLFKKGIETTKIFRYL